MDAGCCGLRLLGGTNLTFTTLRLLFREVERDGLHGLHFS